MGIEPIKPDFPKTGETIVQITVELDEKGNIRIYYETSDKNNLSGTEYVSIKDLSKLSNIFEKIGELIKSRLKGVLKDLKNKKDLKNEGRLAEESGRLGSPN